MKWVGVEIVLLLCITSLVSAAPQLSEKELSEAIMKHEIINYMVQSVADKAYGVINDVQCAVDDNNTITLDLVVSKKQDYYSTRHNITVNQTMEINEALAVRSAVSSYVDVALYYPTVGDLVITTDANKTFTCHRNRVSPSVDREKLGRQIAYNT
jgi:hypothetical protein